MLIRSRLRSPHSRAQGVTAGAKRAMTLYTSLGARRLPRNTNRRRGKHIKTTTNRWSFHPAASFGGGGRYLFSRLAVFQTSSFFFFIGWIGKSDAFIVRALANLLHLIDELRVNFIMHLEKSRSPKEMLFGGGESYVFNLATEYFTRFIRMKTIHNCAGLLGPDPFCFFIAGCLLSLHFKSYRNFLCLLYSYFSQLLRCLALNEQCHYFKHTDPSRLKHKD